MSGWMTRAQATFRRKKKEDVPVSFGIPCSCGGIAAGTREPVYQRVQCEQCRRWLFVLPADPYPVPIARPRRKKRNSKHAETQTPIDTADQPTAMSVTEAKPKPLEESSRPADPLSQRSADDTQPATTVAATARRWRKKLFTPFRLVLLGIVLVVVGTALSVWNRARLDEAARTWQTAREKGRAAIESGDFPTAVREFRRAVQAVDLLARDDMPARATRQRLREAVAADQLLPVSLPEMIRDGEQTIKANPIGWKDRFEGSYKGRWLIMETSLVRVAETNDGDRVVIDCPLVIGSRQVEFSGASAAFSTLDITQVPQRVIFAAAVRSCELSDTTPARWIVELDSDHAFLWSDFEILRRLGLTTGDADEEQRTRLLLTAQANHLRLGGDP